MNVPTINVRLQSITYATGDVSLFDFAALTGALPMARPGAHIDLHLPLDVMTSTRRSIRQYSLLSPFCGPSNYVIGVKREPVGQGGSRWLHDRARVGDEFEISPPRNNFELNEMATDTLLLAGGIGITPIYSMFMRLQELGRRVRLIYSCRSPADALFKEDLIGRPNVVLNYATGPDDGTIATFMGLASSESEVYCCGPAAMITACGRIANDLSLRNWHVERFSAERPAEAGQENGKRFTVKLARSGLSIEVDEGQSILDALISRGIDVPYSCEEGFAELVRRRFCRALRFIVILSARPPTTTVLEP